MPQTILFTDSSRLAHKYSTSSNSVLEILDKNLLSRNDVEFLLLDAVDYKEELGDSPDWNDYKAILADFFVGMGLSHSPSLGLFIIGGDDVIPMPRIESPINEEEELYADFLYCFADKLPVELDADNAQCHVGRLPLENGILETALKDDLQSYFNLVGMMLESGIEVKNVLMTSTESWLPASSDMVRGLPVGEAPLIRGVTKDGIFISPKLDADNLDVMRYYKKCLSKSDMLVFNLHGSDHPLYKSFYGEGALGHNTPIAFTPDLFQESRARIFNTVACFGGRYIGYSRSESMLLNALYGGGIVLYAGSCTSALGRSGQQHIAAHDILIPSGMSESLMKLYSLYLFTGIAAGEAFLRAKCDYFNTCRGLDGDECAMATVLMFNLYGLPTLHVVKQKKVIDVARGVKEYSTYQRSRHFSYSVLFEKKRSDSRDLLSNIRNHVDRNLSIIRGVIESNLYAYWGLNPSDVTKIEKVYENDNPSGYRFEYVHEDPNFDIKHWAYIDNSGNVKDVIHFK